MICFHLDRGPQVVNSPWFIGLLISLIILLIVLFVVCGLMRQKGGKYSGEYEDYFLISNNLFFAVPVPVRKSKHHILMLILIFVFIANFVLQEIGKDFRV